MESKVKTTECDKMKACQPESQKIGAFLEQMQSEGLSICKFSKDIDGYTPLRMRTEEILAKYFEIDLEAVELEKHLILCEHRYVNNL